MAFPRKRRAAFTLTEMLMAAGILGIGLTMVASIFPVAVDQSRRSRDQTMAALCARSVMAQVRANRNAIYNGLRDRTEDFLDLNSAGVFSDTVYKPSVFLYTKGRTYAGVSTWDPGNYVARLFATRTSPDKPDNPWRIAIFVCRSIGKPPGLVESDLWANAVNPIPGPGIDIKPIPGPGTYVVEKRRYGAIGHLVDYVLTDKTGYFAVGFNSRDETGNDKISSTALDIQRVPDAVAVFHTMLGE